MDFPTTEPEILALVDRMYSGYYYNPGQFLHVNRPNLIVRRSSYRTARKNLMNAKAQVKIAAKAKNNTLKTLKDVMKTCLKKSEVDVAANPEKLKLIGWGPKDSPQPVELPGQPTNLQIIAKENGIICLKWDRPSGGGSIRNYIIERRGQIDNWQFAGISYHTQVNLVNQPLGVQIEYRVKAANYAGQSGPSNIVAAVL